MASGIRKISPNLRRIMIVGLLSIVVVMLLVAISQPSGNSSASNFEECIEAGGARMESYPEQCMINGKSFTNTRQTVDSPDQYVGLSEKQALEKAKTEGKPHRVVERDGESLPVTMDFAPDRLNFYVDNGTVTRVEVEGETR